MRKKSDLFSLLLEFSHFQGTAAQLFSQLKIQLRLAFGRNKARAFVAQIFVLPSRTSKSFDFSTFESFFSQTDHLCSLFPVEEFPLKIKNLLGVKPDQPWAIPLRSLESPRTISAFLLLPDSSPELLQAFQIMASMTAHKLALSEWHQRESHGRSEAFLKAYHLGLLCPELFHEIKNKLIAPKIFLQSFPEKFQDRKFRDDFSKIAAGEIEHIQKRLEQILHFSFSAEKKSDDSPSSITLPQIVEQCLSVLDVEIQKHDIVVRMKFDSSFSFPTPTAQTREIIFNLLLNAVQAMTVQSMKEKRGQKILSVCTRETKTKHQFAVEDSGIGIAPEALSRVSEPYFTTKPGGSGLGLATSKRWITQSGGNLSFESQKNKGTRVLISFGKNETSCLS